jgi:hypothetical protein
MKIVGFGDSFTVGIMGHHQRSYIANLCQLPESPFTSYENYAFGGSSNWAIAYQVYRYVAENQYSLDNTFLFIAWSSFSRYSILNKRFTDWSTDYQQAYQIPDRRTEEPPSSSKLLIYETVADDDTRFGHYTQEVCRLLTLDLDTWRQHWNDNIDIIEHNKKLFHLRPYDQIDFSKYR